MERSIESIWKKGFLKGDALIAPKINDLYNQKSTSLIHRFRKKFRLNLILIVVLATGALAVSILEGVPWAGIIMALMFGVLIIIGKRAIDGLEGVDNKSSSYVYLKSFDEWLKRFLSIYAKVYRFFYPLFLFVFMLGYWFSNSAAGVQEKVLNDPEILTLFGVPLFLLIPSLIFTILLSYFSGRIYKFDMKLAYGYEMSKLKEIIEDMEELRK